MRRVIILGAGGRDLHVFNMYYRRNPNYRVVAVAQVQIPGIGGKRYVKGAGELYQPGGVPLIGLRDLEELGRLIRDLGADEVVLAYSDLLYSDVGRIISIVLSSGASFTILGPRDTMIKSSKPMIGVVATRTGAGKSTVSHEVTLELIRRGLRVVSIRHPMIYMNPDDMLVQVFRTREDLAKITFEEREEYEHYIDMGIPVMAGVDYEEILRQAESMADVLLWDGGNNDFPFYYTDFLITVTDARRPGHEVGSFPGEVNTRLADAVIITKVSDSSPESVKSIINNVRAVNPRASITQADLEVYIDDPSKISGRRVLVIEDAPTVTHGGLPYAAGFIAARKYNAEVVDPRPYAVGVIKETYAKYQHMGPVLPSLGYTPEQVRDLEETIRRVPVDVVVMGTPARIEDVVRIDKPIVRVRWRLKVLEGPTVPQLIDEFLERVGLK
ncbi:cyclic 2,3-diphosphoglycerate synthase [Vulcanisaeta thermophila]|uniref:cyclic 2,3-diphosphoglycerate synthase n=1 Tax=Vulcanisaeta thermophila TaxID=867917 RepID=UPI0008532E1C|nr:cyclic 2,3-diphosphoglycerate synthase [Vulcanisaeta thermophila]